VAGDFFGQRISADEVRVFKPAPVVYRHAAGMRTAWVNRSAAPFDTIGQPPDPTVPAHDRLPAALAG
jgi:FMN phosphatase YigB (HAD superfamily)